MPYISTPIYRPINELFPAQIRYSSQNVQEKVAQKIKNGAAQWSDLDSCWKYRFDQGRSLFSVREALPVIKASFGYVLIDGHHNVLSSLALKASSIPVKLVSDLSELPIENFWHETEKLGFAYLYNLQGERQIPPQKFHLLEDDPNRYFATLCARKFADKHALTSTGAEYPVWIKIGSDIPFIEFKIADLLWQHGIIYNYEMGNNPPEDFVEKVRVVLKETPIPGLLVIPERKHYKEIYGSDNLSPKS